MKGRRWLVTVRFRGGELAEWELGRRVPVGKRSCIVRVRDGRRRAYVVIGCEPKAEG